MSNKPDLTLGTTTRRLDVRRDMALRLRYSNKPGTHRISEALSARDWQHVVMALTGTEWGGGYDPPNAGTLRYPWMDVQRVFSAQNDGTELWFGYSDRWEWHIGGREVRRLTRFLIVEWWIKARWLGLRRPLYYAALRSSADRRRRPRP